MTKPQTSARVGTATTTLVASSYKIFWNYHYHYLFNKLFALWHNFYFICF
jgi:hypothetical protein